MRRSSRLARYGVALGERLGLDEDQLLALNRGGILHDVGKVGVPDAVLLKPGALTTDETRQIRLHTVIGDTLCGQMRSLDAVRLIVRHHHERLDGSGYPDGLRGAAIPIPAQVISVVDACDAITTVRPYKAACSREAAFCELRGEADRGGRTRRSSRPSSRCSPARSRPRSEDIFSPKARLLPALRALLAY